MELLSIGLHFSDYGVYQGLCPSDILTTMLVCVRERMWPFFTRKLRLTALGVTVFLWLICATSAARKNTLVSAEGVIVAIQGGITDTRLVEPGSFADLAEIYMVRVERWSQPRKEKYILIEYIHHNDLIRYDEFDKSRWNFEIRQASPEEERDCLSWMAREGSFHPTAFGAKTNLPDPKRLSCFLTEKRPSVVSDTVPKLSNPD
jgi:hypothetical protein